MAGRTEVDPGELRRRELLLPEVGHLLQTVSIVAGQGLGVDGQVHQPPWITGIMPGSSRVQRGRRLVDDFASDDEVRDAEAAKRG